MQLKSKRTKTLVPIQRMKIVKLIKNTYGYQIIYLKLIWKDY